jgi:holliday junction DNA helicase RuvA
MISLIIGTIYNISKNTICILTPAGIGYDVYVTALYAAELRVGQKVEIATYLKVAETALELFGFRSLDEKKFFQLLLGVKGIGPKGAMNVLALGSVGEIQSAIGRSDVKYLTAVQGMGKKTAERLVVELKSKVVAVQKENGVEIDSGSLGEVVEALVSMGYAKEDVRDIVKPLDSSLSVEVLLREALKML